MGRRDWQRGSPSTLRPWAGRCSTAAACEEALVPYEPFADAVGESGLDAAALEERLASVPGERLFLMLDDLQWADRATLALLGRLVRGHLAERLLVIGAYREDEAQGAALRRVRRPAPGAAPSSGSSWAASAWRIWRR